jgi:hypothetical protein
MPSIYQQQAMAYGSLMQPQQPGPQQGMGWTQPGQPMMQPAYRPQP